jgi:predicted GNAT family N-acyltransferase
VRHADWAVDGAALCALRREVFVLEQGVPEADEWDGLDPGCEHVIALAAGGGAIGTGRLLPDGRIGRMAVRQSWRGRGVGSALLAALIARARERGFEQARLHAQTHALGFYQRHGFESFGGEFLDAGIPHYAMRLALKPTDQRAG